MSSSSHPIDERVAELLWSLWSELGVPGVVPARHQDQYIDQEALILCTAVASDLDPRLRDESIDWVIRHNTYLSKARLKNLRLAWHVVEDPSFARYAATVNHHAHLGWPTRGRPLPFRPRGRSVIADPARPSLIALRSRAAFGVGARAELLRAFVGDPGAATAAALSAETNYGKRNVLNALEGLRFAGLVEVRRVGNADHFRLVERRAVVALIGPAPAAFPRWNRILPIVLQIRQVIRASAARAGLEPAIAAHRFVEAQANAIRAAGLSVPALPRGQAAWATFTDWADHAIRDLGR